MGNITLIIRRDGSFTGAAVPYHIFIYGTEVGALAVGRGFCVEIEIGCQDTGMEK